MWLQGRLLDAARDSLGAGATDYRLCKVLGISTAYMSQLRRGTSIVSQTMAMRLALLAKIQPEEVLPAIEMQRASQHEEDSALIGTWQRIARKVSGKAAVWALSAGLGISGLAAPAPSQAATAPVEARAIHYAK